MAYVSVPKDLTKVKNKVVFNLTRRQLICFGIAGVIGIPFYFLTRDLIGNGNAMMGMVILMVPAFLFAMYEKDGMPLEKVLMNMITVKYKRPHVRIYETVNLYELPDLPQDTGTSKKRKEIGKKAGLMAETSFNDGNFGRNMGTRNMSGPEGRPFSDGNRAPAYGRGAAGGFGINQEGGRNRARQG